MNEFFPHRDNNVSGPSAPYANADLADLVALMFVAPA
jgi:hypothetical protein